MGWVQALKPRCVERLKDRVSAGAPLMRPAVGAPGTTTRRAATSGYENAHANSIIRTLAAHVSLLF